MVRGWLEESEPLTGLAIDTEEKRDATATGSERAAEARAALPTPEAKAEAWRRVVEDVATPNQTRRAISHGWARARP